MNLTLYNQHVWREIQNKANYYTIWKLLLQLVFGLNNNTLYNLEQEDIVCLNVKCFILIHDQARVLM